MGKENSVSEKFALRASRHRGPRAHFTRYADRLPGLRTCAKIAKLPREIRKAVWQGAMRGRIRSGLTERATRPDGLSCSRPQVGMSLA